MTEAPWNEKQDIARLCQGDQEALVRVYQQYSGLVYGVALRVLHDVPAAEDVTQDVFLQLWRNPLTFDAHRGPLAPWLAVIARNKAVDLLRKRKPEQLDESRPIDPPSTELPLHLLADAEKAKRLLGQLPAEQRRVLEMAFLDGLTHVEISEKTGEPLGTVKSRIRLGLISLRKGLAL